MNKSASVILLATALSLAVVAGEDLPQDAANAAPPQWSADTEVEVLWSQYAAYRGGLTWGKSSSYPEYAKVKEGDTILIQLEQGPCLMEFFHSRWRRANDVRRWDNSVNEYGSCPYVFD